MKNLLTLYGDETKRIFKDIAPPSDFSFETIEVDEDHIHCLVKSEPRISPLAIVRRVKQESTIQLWRVHERELRRHFWKAHDILERWVLLLYYWQRQPGYP